MSERWATVRCRSEQDEQHARTYLECEVGDFTVPGKWASSVTFTDDDAVTLARLGMVVAGSSSRLVVAFYPWVQDVWKELSASRWTTLFEKVFTRPGLFGVGGENLWVVGYAHDEDKLVEVLNWAWTLPGRDTLLMIPTEPAQVGPLVQVFADDREDDGSNEVRLLEWYPIILSRGREGRCVRVVTTSFDQAGIEALISSLRE